MEIVRDTNGLRGLERCILVPTMGALHAGHAALIRLAAHHAGERSVPVVVSVFVNPTQFNEQSDFEKYPRDLDADAALAKDAGATHIFAPTVEVMYPQNAQGGEGRVPALPKVADGPMLEDHFRPGHFKGVCQVCLRLFEITNCAAALFGEKDWQQLQTIRALVTQEQLNTTIIPAPTVREWDGLAMSSRNRHLAPTDRARAVALSRALEAASTVNDIKQAERIGREVLDAAWVQTEYFAIRDAETLTGVREGRPARALVAGRVSLGAGKGDVRLIDNAPWPGFVRRV